VRMSGRQKAQKAQKAKKRCIFKDWSIQIIRLSPTQKGGGDIMMG
jgi:hypothetical protein